MKPHKHAELIKANLHRFRYNHENGVLYWVDGRIMGSPAGSVDSHGYLQVKLQGIPVFAHRIIWAIFGREQPEQIDHIDRDRLNNRIGNLRMSNNSLNQHNASIRKDNSSGAVGVTKKSNGKYQARIAINGVRKHLGTFDTLKEAKQAVNKIKESIHG